jgi:hypothetical protein
LILGPKVLRKLQKTLENEREERRDVTQTKEELFGRPPRCCMQLVPFKVYRCPAKSASKSLLEMLQKHQFLLQKFLCIHRKFPARYYDIKIYF